MSDSIHDPTVVKSKDDLPPDRDRTGIRPVSPPLSNMSFRRFNQYLAFIVAIILAFYAWRLTVLKAEAGGWWNLALGRRVPIIGDNQGTRGSGSNDGLYTSITSGDANRDKTVEERINELASALGMPSKDLASAIAVAVHEYVPPASISSIASHQTGDAVKYIIDPSAAAEADASAPAASKGFNVAAKAFEAVVGMEEPPSEMS